jgi:hypothetical protein
LNFFENIMSNTTSGIFGIDYAALTGQRLFFDSSDPGRCPGLEYHSLSDCLTALINHCPTPDLDTAWFPVSADSWSGAGRAFLLHSCVSFDTITVCLYWKTLQ